MCNSNVRQDQDLREVLAAILHNASTMLDDLGILLLTRQLESRQGAIIEEAEGHVAKAGDVLRMLLSGLPKVTR